MGAKQPFSRMRCNLSLLGAQRYEHVCLELRYNGWCRMARRRAKRPTLLAMATANIRILVLLLLLFRHRPCDATRAWATQYAPHTSCMGRMLYDTMLAVPRVGIWLSPQVSSRWHGCLGLDWQRDGRTIAVVHLLSRRPCDATRAQWQASVQGEGPSRCSTRAAQP